MTGTYRNSVQGISVNTRAAALVKTLQEQADVLRVGVSKGDLGETLIDAGASHRGGVAAGVLVAEICMGGLGAVSMMPNAETPRWPWSLVVRSSNPVIACLASQYAGWSLAHGEGAEAFFALGSGPARALAQVEPLFREIAYVDSAFEATLVIEADKPPPAPVVEQVAKDCRLKPGQLTFIYAPTRSLAGCCQVVARVLEVALHKVHELKFPLDRIIDGMGTAPLCPPHPDFVTAMGRTNDAIIYAGRVHLFVTGPDDDAKSLAEQLPSRTSRDFGQPFADIFKRFNGDFYAIDKMLFSPAEAIVSAIDSGRTFRSGAIDTGLLDRSFDG